MCTASWGRACAGPSLCPGTGVPSAPWIYQGHPGRVPPADALVQEAEERREGIPCLTDKRARVHCRDRSNGRGMGWGAGLSLWGGAPSAVVGTGWAGWSQSIPGRAQDARGRGKQTQRSRNSRDACGRFTGNFPSADGSPISLRSESCRFLGSFPSHLSSASSLSKDEVSPWSFSHHCQCLLPSRLTFLQVPVLWFPLRNPEAPSPVSPAHPNARGLDSGRRGETSLSSPLPPSIRSVKTC